MTVAPAGTLAVPLDEVRKVMVRSPYWQAWVASLDVNANHADRVHLNANRDQIEVENNVIQYLNDSLPTPFIILWLSDWALPIKGPSACHVSARVMFFVQDQARDRHDHGESSNTFLTDLGGLIDDIAADFDQREGTSGASLGTADVAAIEMVGMPIRTGVPESQDPRNDMWTSAFSLLIGPGG